MNELLGLHTFISSLIKNLTKWYSNLLPNTIIMLLLMIRLNNIALNLLKIKVEIFFVSKVKAANKLQKITFKYFKN